MQVSVTEKKSCNLAWNDPGEILSSCDMLQTSKRGRQRHRCGPKTKNFMTMGRTFPKCWKGS